MLSTVRDNCTPKVLVVEDNRELAELYADWLCEPYDVEVAYNSDEAYARFHEPFDVALLDRRLPTTSGDDILTDIRDFGLDWRVAMITAKEPSVDVLEMAFDEYLCKPLSRNELQSTVTRLVACTEFKQAVTEYARLTSKKALVEAHCSPDELAASDEYAALEHRLETLETNLNELTDAFPEMPPSSRVKTLLTD